ncbi:hypothetical protein ACFXPB_27275 [Streptomyces sp. NPDC059129]|uniref:hypothetical protein n=1 Tax=Streptomyces sp. NPDC059129 TaxID=3346734 RepID=UPI003680325B
MHEAARPLLLANVQLLDGSTADVHLGAGRIQAVTATGAQDPIGEVIDLSGHLLLPAPAEPHGHFDKVLLGGVDIGGGPGGLDTAVAAWYTARQSISPSDVRDRALRAAKELLASGATARGGAGRRGGGSRARLETRATGRGG